MSRHSDTVGPMCKTVVDATTLLEVMSGDKKYSQFLCQHALVGVRLGLVRNSAWDPNSTLSRSVYETSILSTLEKLGATVVNVNMSRMDEYYQWQAYYEWQKGRPSIISVP